MNTKELISGLKERLQIEESRAELLLEATIKIVEKELLTNSSVGLQGFGTFEVRKKDERISVNPVTKQRMLVPPKLALAFKPSSILKERIKTSKNS